LVSGLHDGGPANDAISAGVFRFDLVRSDAVSRAIRLGVGTGRVVTGPFELGPAEVLPAQGENPAAGRAVVLWEGARDSLDQHGLPDRLVGLVDDPRILVHPGQVRFRVVLLSTAGSDPGAGITTIRLPYSLSPP
jgi:hypothetical protein